MYVFIMCVQKLFISIKHMRIYISIYIHMAMYLQIALRTGESFTPSPVIAVTLPALVNK
jgi:hypothetical protein